jgi:hypothetical protein
MPGKLYTDDLAERIRKSGDKSYRPSNGTEGDMFQALWCEQCKRDADFKDGEGEGCQIIAMTMCVDVDDPEYPKEWTHDSEGQPCCTAFERR